MPYAWFLLLAFVAATWTVSPSVALHLDHVPIVVRDLPAAERTFRELGFRIKPGRPHPNSIRNASIKFADGSYLELITATEARDALSREYLELLRRGEGAAYAFLRDDADGGVADRWVTAGGQRESAGPFVFTEPPASWGSPHLQLIDYPDAARESPDLLRHDNGARRLRALWLVSARWSVPLRRALGAKRVEPGDRPFLAAGVARVDRVGLADGACLFLIESASLARDGFMVLAASVEREAGGAAIWLPPERAHGIWLELAPVVPGAGGCAA